MAYQQWNKEKLELQKAQLEYLYREKNDITALRDLELINIMLKKEGIFFAQAKSFREKIEDNIQHLTLYEDFIEDINKFAELQTILQARIPEYNCMDIRSSHIFSFVHDFYNQFDKDIANTFNKIFREKRNNLVFTSGRSVSYYLKTFEYSYLKIGRTGTIHDFINPVHEYAHAISDSLYYRSDYDNNYPFIELFPLFMELITCDKLTTTFENMDDEVTIAKANNLNAIIQYAEELALQFDCFSSIECAITKKQIITNLSKTAQTSKKNIKNMLDISNLERLAYLIPYMVAIELYYIYQSDPEKALYILKTLITLPQSENYMIPILDNDIILNEHAKAYTKNIQDNIKKAH